MTTQVKRRLYAGEAPIESLNELSLRNMNPGTLLPFAQAQEGFWQAIKNLGVQGDASDRGLFCGLRDGQVDIRDSVLRGNDMPIPEELNIGGINLGELIAEFGYEVIKVVLRHREIMQNPSSVGKWFISPTGEEGSSFGMNIQPTVSGRTIEYDERGRMLGDRRLPGGKFVYRKADPTKGYLDGYGNHGTLFFLN